jgi:hypothetical protein
MKQHIRPNQPGRSGRYISPSTTADEYGLSLRHLKNLRATRRLPFIRVGHRCVLFDRVDIEQFLAARRVEAIGARVQA